MAYGAQPIRTHTGLSSIPVPPTDGNIALNWNDSYWYEDSCLTAATNSFLMQTIKIWLPSSLAS
jgi:hypothetical protein